MCTQNNAHIHLIHFLHRWVKCSPHCLENSCPVKGLEEGKGYEFRVVAENLHGQSEPLTVTETVIAKWPFSESPSFLYTLIMLYYGHSKRK